ncbi:MAG TPA: phenylalanine--tRNA ligase subunit beta [Candidatus Saccharimonadales bacterium]|nr:phenylalanine--tRNA ligase subunit beta [Candidatus Saccharimonadales bacterium]
MKISLNHIRFYQNMYNWSADPAPHGVDALVDRIGAQLGAVEEVTDFGKKYEGVLVAKVVSCRDHENSDHLHVCQIDDGGKAQDVERDENGHVTVVCGAPNVREGLTVAWLPPGSTVPDSYDTAEPFVLSARPLRGVVSNGMLASPRELALSDSHEGILEITDDIAPGTSFAEATNVHGDKIIDIENKMFTHRPDCFGMMGVAREIAGIQQQAFTSPEWYKADAALPKPTDTSLPITIRNEIPELTPRFMAVSLSDITVGPSPLWLQVSLARLGVRPINNIVDYTNYFMLFTGQPLHAYDYDKVKTQDANADHATLVIRHPKAGEKITLLNGKEIEPRAEAIMIATQDKLIGVGGVVGGADTEVDQNTKNIILECATFDMYSIRRTAMAHGLFTDAVTRNNKGQSPLQNAAVLAKIVDDLRKDGARVASEVIDDNHVSQEIRDRGTLHPAITVTADFVNVRLGLKLPAAEMAQLLINVEFRVDVQGEELTITAPFWRTDIAIPEDIVEEVGRLYGFDHLPLELPDRTVDPTVKNHMYELKKQIRTDLTAAGANEVLTYSFVHGNMLQKAGQDPNLAFQLSNALSPDLQYFRLSLTPSLLDKVHMNIKAGHDKFALFEMNKTHNLLQADDDHGLPTEFNMLSLVIATNDKRVQKGQGAAYYEARKYLERLAESLGIAVQFEPITTEPNLPVVRPFDMQRSAIVRVKGTDIYLGIVGEFKASVRKQFKLPTNTAGFEIGLNELQGTAGRTKGYVQLPRFPKVEQDICLKIPASTQYGDLYNFVWQKLAEVQPENTLPTLSPVDIYQREDDAEHKQITLRLSIASYEKTMTDAEVSKMLDHVAQAAHEAFSAERV